MMITSRLVVYDASMGTPVLLTLNDDQNQDSLYAASMGLYVPLSTHDDHK